MNPFYRFAAILGFALAPAQAHALQPVSFDLTALTSGNIYSATDMASGLKITASAWSSTTGGASFAPAALTVATDGLGVCNASESGCSASNTLGALGDSAGIDMILFSFNAPVTLQTLTISKFAGATSNLSIWAGTGALPASTLPTSLGSSTLFDVASNKDDVKISNVLKLDYDWVAVATKLDAFNDLTKLRSLTVQVNPQAQPVPDAATWMTMLAGLGLVAFRVNRRRSA